jgi:hypothetical protein
MVSVTDVRELEALRTNVTVGRTRVPSITEED